MTLLVVSAVPLVLVVGAATLFTLSQPSVDYQKDIAPVAGSENGLIREISKLPLSLDARTAMYAHDSAVAHLTSAFSTKHDQAIGWTGKVVSAAALVAALVLLLVAAGAAVLARQYAAPLSEIVEWTRRIQRHEELPPTLTRSTVPELIMLQRSLHELQRGLEKARTAELEAERLRAFGEVARRVAHEMKNPLTPIRLAVRQLSRRAPPDMHVELEVIAAESARLEGMARDFAELGRLPEGFAAPVDLGELLQELLQNAVPEAMERKFASDGSGATIEGYYDPLRRAFSNLLRNAVEACQGAGRIAIGVRHEDGSITVTLSDNGPGIEPEQREMIFQPYFSGKADGTGLGLAIVRQTVEQHRGTIAVSDTVGGGATFTVQFPI